MLTLFLLACLHHYLKKLWSRFKCSFSRSWLFTSEHAIILTLAAHLYVLSMYGVWSKAWAAVNLDAHYVTGSVLSMLAADFFCLSVEIFEIYKHEVKKWLKRNPK